MRIGIDLGGTKTEAILIDEKGNKLYSKRILSEQNYIGTIKDIANLVEFLCSSRSSFITGQSFVVDGGLSMVNQEAIARRLTNLKH